MSKEIVIVTAFFDIHRENFEVYQRSSEQYFEYFKFWARIQNRIIVYCQKQNYEKIYQIREEFGLKDKTDIIILENIYEIEPDIYKRMCEISRREDFKSSRYFDVALSNRADYDYVMLLKYWCLFDSSKRIDADVNFAWVDFGFNHGGKLYTNPKDFSFYWEYPFEDVINIFCLSNPKEMSGFESLQFQKDCVIGTYFILPKTLIKSFWNSMKLAMYSLLSLDCIDDDQQLLLMVYKLHEDWFKVIVSDWFELFVLCSNRKFSLLSSNPSKENETHKIEQYEHSGQGKSIRRNLILKAKNILQRTRKEQAEEVPVTQSRRFAHRIYKKALKFYGP